MTITGLDHVELFVADVDKAADVFEARLGLGRRGRHDVPDGPAPHTSLVLDCGSCALVLTSAHDARHPAADFVDRHGDGVAGIGLATSDAEAAYRRAVAGGATPVEAPRRVVLDGGPAVLARVGGFGDVTHALVERSVAAGAGGASSGGITGVDHVAVCLPAAALAPAAARYERAFGFQRSFELSIAVGSQAMDSVVVQAPAGGPVLTLVAQDPARDPGQIDDFLEDHGGPGVQHVAFAVADIVAAVGVLRRAGVDFLDVPPAYYDHLGTRLDPDELVVLRAAGILHDRDHAGAILQTFTRSAHPRGTLFFELVERRGAVSFGAGNVRALYEAVSSTAGPGAGSER